MCVCERHGFDLLACQIGVRCVGMPRGIWGAESREKWGVRGAMPPENFVGVCEDPAI